MFLKNTTTAEGTQQRLIINSVCVTFLARVRHAKCNLQTCRYIIAENAGLDGAELVTQLRSEHHKGNSTAGIDILTGEVGDMQALGIREPLKLKLHVLLSAAEATEMILRVDDIIKCAPRQRQEGMQGMH